MFDLEIVLFDSFRISLEVEMFSSHQALQAFNLVKWNAPPSTKEKEYNWSGSGADPDLNNRTVIGLAAELERVKKPVKPVAQVQWNVTREKPVGVIKRAGQAQDF